MTIPVSAKTLKNRINCMLAREGRAGWKMQWNPKKAYMQNLGDYYIVDLDSNSIIGGVSDLEEYGREMGALRNFEHMVDK